MSSENNGEFAQRVLDAIQAFGALDAACEKVKEKGICDAIGVKYDVGCQLFVKKDAFLKFLESLIKAFPPASTDVIFPKVPEEPLEAEEPKPLKCPSCGGALREWAKFCDLCGEEL